MGERTFRLEEKTVRLSAWKLFAIQFAHVGWAISSCCTVWLMSPNAYVALVVILLCTAYPLHILMGTGNVVGFVLLELHKLIPMTVPIKIWMTICAGSGVLYGKLMHGYEVHGMENLPTKSGGLLVYYHALMPHDMIFLACQYYLEHGKTLGGIVHYLSYMIENSLFRLFDLYPERDRLVEDLKQGHLRSVAPGGGRESIFSGNYELLWEGRTGFAQVAKECKVPVIPMFCVNSDQAMPIKTFGLPGLFMWVLEKYRFLLYVPTIAFPAKLRIVIGKPIYCGAAEDAQEFADRVKAAIYKLRDEHQEQPLSILSAISERFGSKPFNRRNKKTE